MRWRHLICATAPTSSVALRRQLPLIGEALAGAIPKPPLPGEVARRSRDGEVVPGRDNLSVACGASSPARGALGAAHPGAFPYDANQ